MLEPINEWGKRSRCTLERPNPDLFFSETDRAAKEFCRSCLVVSQCKLYAIAHDEKGVWGATSHQERKAYGDWTETIRSLYIQAGLLESRTFLVREQRRQEEQLKECTDPIAPPEAC